MHTATTFRSFRLGGLTAATYLGRAVVLLLPTGLLLGASLRSPGQVNVMLWTGTGFQALVCLLSFLSRPSWRQPIGPSVIALYLIALAWVWLADGLDDWYMHLVKAVLLVVPLLVFALQTLRESGAPALRRARMLSQRLTQRREWPSDLGACRALPEVKALRASLIVDATPALALLQDPRPQVRVAALTALEFRKDWRPGQAEMVLMAAQRAQEPALRAAAVTALGNVDDCALVEVLAGFLTDPALEVRRATAEALMWDTDHRWSWIRPAVRRVLADPLCQNDGPLWHEGQPLTPEAVKDLNAWCAEKGALAGRAAQTLAAHYSRALSERPDETLPQALRQQLTNPATPAVLRIELARVMHNHQELESELLEKLLLPSYPAPVRLIAVEALLADDEDGSRRATATTALRDVARLPNREIALATAALVQRRLGVDLGLALGQPLPPVNSRHAADVTRRVMAWAAQQDAQEDVADSQPLTF
jgi:hypothetical protein